MSLRSTKAKSGLFFLVCVSLIVIVVVGGIAAAVQSRHNLIDMTATCEAKGGALLDHTEQVGKYQHHHYTCVDKRMILDN